ncbi:tonsoku-like protein [Mizuhopecten yessoensis]|uniref:Tonsoku-like protein n=1 Tax=Mizuhopecten yessoensis TaxID=6573 RepID=A0A210R0Z4_MIZYE|nr:tonsoku-like protein [Mizuhopecten yessoensis]OWF54535.1 Tonsoku-like protein [Mizuhopecten yessoensis]
MNPADEKEVEKLQREKRKAERNNNLREVAVLCNCIGEILAKSARYEEAIVEHEAELAIHEALHDRIGCAVACRKVGECYCGQERYEEALQLQQRHLNLAKSCQNLLEEQRAWATIGRTYLFQIETSKGKSVREGSIKRAKDAFFKSLEVCEKLKSSVQNVEYMEMKARLYLNLGLVFDSSGDLQQCAEFMKKAISISQKHSLHSDLYRCQVSLASMYQRGGNLSQAQRYLEAAHKSAIKLKDKSLESEVFSQKAIISLLLGDYNSSKHALKKTYKLGALTQEEKDRIFRIFKAVSKMEDASLSLSDLPEGEPVKKLKLYETMGDCSAEIGNFKQALEYYSSMLTCAEAMQKPKKEMIPIYVSLAQTYADDKQFTQAIEYYNRELMCRKDDQEQMCRTWINIAECQEQRGDKYDVVSDSLVKGFHCAKDAKHRKLQVFVLKSLVEVQKAYKQSTKQIEEKCRRLKDKYNVTSDDELSEEERDSQRSDDTEDDGNLSIDDLTESEHSSSDEENIVKRVTVPVRGVAKRLTTKRNEKGETALHKACISGNLKKVKKLIEQGHPVNPRDYCGWIPLHEAANHDHSEIVSYLLEHGAAVNDRGGQHCGGVTPLIDAANCGNLDVMRVLIDHKANELAKDDEGNTALSCLRQWRERCEDALESHVLKTYEELHRLLSSPARGGPAASRSPEVLSSQLSLLSRRAKGVDNTSPDIGSLTRPVRARTKKSLSMRRTMSSDESGDSDTENIARKKMPSPAPPLVDDDDDSEELYPNPLSPVTPVTSNATQSYRQAIHQIGSSARRRKASHQSSHATKSHHSNSTAALISAEEFVDDDWLIDDLQPMKRRRIDVGNVFSTSGIRNKSSQKEKRNVINSDSESDEETTVENADLLMDTGLIGSQNTSNDNGVSDNTNLESDTEDIMLLNEEEYVSDDLPPLTLRTSRSSRPNILSQVSIPGLSTPNVTDVRGMTSKPRQMRMTQFAIRQPDSSQSSLPSEPLSQTSGVSSNLASTAAVGQVMRVKVRVKDKLLLVPAPNGGEGKTIGWLAHESSQRYYSLCGLRPFLTLTTKDGAFLAPDDPISLVLSADEEVQASVDSWDMPPLSQRYDQACRTLHTVSYRNVRTILQGCDTSGNLELQNLALRPAQVIPVFRAIQCQSNLKDLNLTGNRVGDTGLEGLLNVLGSLPNLTSLFLAGNRITSVAVKQLGDTLTGAVSTGAVLQNLSCLDLSHNSLGDSSCQYLATVVACLPSITNLNLSSCDLSAKFFQQHRVKLATALQKCDLQCVDVSCNKFGALGIELLLMSLNAARLIQLNVAGNMTTASASSHLLLHLQNYLSQENCALEELDISSSHICSEDLDFIVRILESGKYLKDLRLSGNSKLTNSVVRRILEKSGQNDTKLDQLSVEGCGLKSPLDTPFLDAVSDKLATSHPLRSLSFTCIGLDKVDIDSLSQIWLEQWKDIGQVDVTDLSVKLQVLDM